MTPSTLQDRYEAGELPPFSIHPSVQAFAPEYYLDDYFVPPPIAAYLACLLYTSPSPRDATLSRMPSSA